jgi:hypothetical protein
MRRLAIRLAAALLCLGLVAPSASARPGPAGRTANKARLQGAIPLRVGNHARYLRAKAAAAARAGQHVPKGAAGPQAPGIDLQWDGIFDDSLTPPDPNGAIGANSYMEVINAKYAIYDRAGGLINSGTLGQLAGSPDFLVDPRILWDTKDRKFYYLFLNVTRNTLNWGYSKNDNPQSSADFCKYVAEFGYGNDLPDYPKLGNTPNFLLIGVNTFQNGQFYIGSDIDWIYKGFVGPGPIGNCPPQAQIGRFANVRDASGKLIFTPVPAVMTDNKFSTVNRGFVVSTPDLTSQPGFTANYLTLIGVKESTFGSASLTAPVTIPVPTYTIPPNAPQCQGGRVLDTLDGRLEHAVEGSDPVHAGFGLWTAHAVAGGAGSEERWYEINPFTNTLIQSGVATSPTLYVWNGAVSPDRRVGPDGSAFGGNMVMGFNTSSAATCTAIQMVSKVGNNPQSAFVLVKQSPGVNWDNFCNQFGFCRWGDYSGANPDPAADMTQPAGRVWLTNEWNVASQNNLDKDARTHNWKATP